MTRKFLARTIRNVVSPNRPYFAHLALTHRCNLRCSFCHITETKFQELDTAGFFRVVDILDELGVAVISISGGGEPLIRPDFADIINHAAERGIYTKLTSNGTMPRSRYERLLASRIDEIGISLDGIDGDNLPFSHVGPPILETLRYLNDHLPEGKQLTINVTITEDNQANAQEIVDYCGREYPRARVWLNPVMAGDGALRSADAAAVAPTYLRTTKGPTLLSAEFYRKGVEQQFEDTVQRGCAFDWQCKAGQMFFDIKPNGDFWFCQDLPSPIRLNILDPDFLEQWKALDLEPRRQCSGCTYSCYYVPQQGMRPQNFKDMGLLWWQAHTHEGDICRRAADRFGFLGAIWALAWKRLQPLPEASYTTFLLLMALVVAVAASAHGGEGLAARSFERSDPEQVLTCMEQSNEARRQRLPAYRSEREYRAGSAFLKKQASASVELRYEPPGSKRYAVLERSGSGVIHKRVILQLVETECRNASLEASRATDVHRRNYQFSFVSVDEQTGDFVFAAEPHSRSRYLFRGKVWIEPGTCGIRRIAGEPAVKPSFWVKRTRFEHEYTLVDGFWLPRRHHSDVELKLFGGSQLDIEYGGYEWLPQQAIAVQSNPGDSHIESTQHRPIE